MKYEVYVRAKRPNGKIDTVHVNDLTEESFRNFLMYRLVEAGLVVGVKEEGEMELYAKES